MKSLIQRKQILLTINKSKFIGIAEKITSLKNFQEKLTEISSIYNDASHICYAYIIDDNIKCTDNGEPSGTAGQPILEILKKNDLNYTAIFIIRYFGGIKLGAGGLLRAYSNTARETLIDNVKELEKGYFVLINDNYNKERIINNIIKENNIIEKNYTDNIKIKALINENTLNNLKDYNINFNIEEETYI